MSQTQVQSGFIENGAVTTAKIADSNVTSAKISTGGPSWDTTGSLTIGGLPFLRNIPTISTDYTITTTYNEMSIGPITINSGVTVIVNSGATWTVV